MNMSLRVVLLKTGLTPLNIVRPVNIAHLKSVVHSAKSKSHFSKQAQSTAQRPFYKQTTLTRRSAHTAKRHYYNGRPRAVNTARLFSTIRGKPQKDDKGFVDSGWSRHMTGNIAYLSDFKEFDGGYVAFGGGAYGGRITGKGTLKTDNLDFEDNVVPKESLTCLVAKVTLDESMLWHRRLGKQHRASCKSKVLNPITKPLFMLHMDLFGPTFVSSLMHKKYCLVVTDDYSRFTWVFFLTTKDETREILKNFIKEIENLVDKKVKIIKSDNGTEFKNKVMDDFYREKGIKGEYSVARTPQQNGVAKRRNRTLTEATRTMLADSKLSTTFWAEAVSTACYVQNRDVDNGEPKTANDAQKQVEDGLNNENAEHERFANDSGTKDVNAAGKHINAASPDIALTKNRIDLGTSTNSYIFHPPPYKNSQESPIDKMIGEVKLNQQALLKPIRSISWVEAMAGRTSAIQTLISMDTGRSPLSGKKAIGTKWEEKQTVVSHFYKLKLQYVVAASCCEQALWIQNQLLDYRYNFMNTAINIDNNKNYYAKANSYAVEMSWCTKVATVSPNSYILKHCLRGGSLLIQPKGMDERMCYIISSGPRCQDTILGVVNAQTRFEISFKQSNDPPLSRGYTLGSGEDSMKLIGIDGIGTDCLPTATIFEELACIGNKKYRGLNSSEGGNIEDGVKIAGGVIGSGGGIESSEELKEVLPDVADEAEV
ncbi:putative ribonuclease H-like domain-containing protein [Tanacetum coccineum]